MNKIIIKEFHFNNEIIYFNKYINYLVGQNAIGKTTFYNAIQYVLGLRKNILDDDSKLVLDSKSILIRFEVKSKNYEFRRTLHSNNIEVFAENQIFTFKYSSEEYSEYLNTIFKPYMFLENYNALSKNLLTDSFIDEMRIHNYNFNNYRLLPFCIDKDLEDELQKSIKKLEKEISIRKNELEILKSYNISVIKDIKKNKIDNLKIDQIMKEKLEIYAKPYETYLSQFYDYKDFYETVSKKNKSRINLIIKEVSNTAKNNYWEIKDLETILSNYFLNKKYISDKNNISVTKSFIHLLFQSSEHYLNNNGLIIVDHLNVNRDQERNNIHRKILKEYIQKYEFQYIEFCDTDNFIDKDLIIYNFLKKGYLYER